MFLLLSGHRQNTWWMNSENTNGGGFRLYKYIREFMFETGRNYVISFRLAAKPTIITHYCMMYQIILIEFPL